jgi:hypothetical protein
MRGTLEVVWELGGFVSIGLVDLPFGEVPKIPKVGSL